MYYLGGYKSGDSWTWLNGLPGKDIDLDWLPNQPNNRNAEVLIIKRITTDGGKMVGLNDVEPQHKRSFLCEKNMV